jgi:hypothetical protein
VSPAPSVLVPADVTIQSNIEIIVHNHIVAEIARSVFGYIAVTYRKPAAF